MRLVHTALLATAALSFAAPAFAQAGPKTETGGYGDLVWEATNRIVGVTSTGLANAGGDPRYFATDAKYSGTVALLMDYGGGQVFICSGSLLPDRVSILTAAHCVSDGAGTPGPLSVRAFFNGSSDPDFLPTLNGSARDVSKVMVQSQYTGFVIDHNDIAVLRLANAAPDWAKSYELSTLTDLTGQDFNVAGYGARSTIGGNFGTNAGTGRLRQGDNRMEWRVGDAAFAGTTYGIFGPQSRTEFSYLSDFDNGLAANDASCRFASASNFAGLGIAGTAKFCNLGRGANEVSVAGGDSGGPQFDSMGRIMSVTSYGITFGGNFGDIRGGLQSSFGEFNGFVPVYLHTDFIAGAMGVPEPGTWAMLILGFGLVGATARRRRETSVAA
jgi:V8-like Glu-specific endopeptidase